MHAIALAMALSAVSRSSFDCGASITAAERMVCSQPVLAALDSRLAALYRQATAAPADEAAIVRRAQRAWLARRDAICIQPELAACLDGAYRERIDELTRDHRLRQQAQSRPAADGNYAGFMGRWRVVGVDVADDGDVVKDFGENDSRYMGLVLSAEPGSVRWLNGARDEGTDGRCDGPSFMPRQVMPPPRWGWKAVTLECLPGGDVLLAHAAITLRNVDMAEMGGEDGALLQLRREPPGATVPPTPHAAAQPDASGWSLKESPGDRAFFLALRRAVSQDDRAWLAGHVGQTVTVYRRKGSTHAYGSAEVLEAYDWIMTPEIKRAVLAQDPDALFKNEFGLMVGNGEVWFGQFWDGKAWTYAVQTINQVDPTRPRKTARSS